jgi:heme/copper-type cytochrome/quinol oxidase subunit 2
VLILLAVGIPSISLIYGLEEVSRAVQLSVRFTGRQWYWVYGYPTLSRNDAAQGLVTVEAALRDPKDPAFPANGSRLLDSTPLLLPVGVVLQLLATSEDVIHSLALPSLGIKMDAVPGRLNGVVVVAEAATMLWGQCSELCGPGHALMPISVLFTDPSAVNGYLLEEAGVGADYAAIFCDKCPDISKMVAHGPHDQLKELSPALELLRQSTQELVDGAAGSKESVEKLTKTVLEKQTEVQKIVAKIHRCRLACFPEGNH